MTGKVTSNPELYRALSRPFGSEAEANERIERFFAAVSAARVEYGIADVYVIARVLIDTEQGIVPGVSTFRKGDPLQTVPMLGYAIGEERGAYDAFIADHVAAGAAQRKREEEE